ncbi:MAG: hypothetical protein KME30_30300 [Iphinoe sp. HA4291-MV1]|jgi:chromosome segregation ATPase|nr:hypothetical protein [Iphinoe sp. HA4291-MV1]
MLNFFVNFLKEFNTEFHCQTISHVVELSNRIEILEKTLLLASENFIYVKKERDYYQEKYEEIKDSFISIAKQNINLEEELEEAEDIILGCRNRADSCEKSLNQTQAKLTLALLQIEALQKELNNQESDHDICCREYLELVDSLRFEIQTLKETKTDENN